MAATKLTSADIERMKQAYESDKTPIMTTRDIAAHFRISSVRFRDFMTSGKWKRSKAYDMQMYMRMRKKTSRRHWTMLPDHAIEKARKLYEETIKGERTIADKVNITPDQLTKMVADKGWKRFEKVVRVIEKEPEEVRRPDPWPKHAVFSKETMKKHNYPPVPVSPS